MFISIIHCFGKEKLAVSVKTTLFWAKQQHHGLAFSCGISHLLLLDHMLNGVFALSVYCIWHKVQPMLTLLTFATEIMISPKGFLFLWNINDEYLSFVSSKTVFPTITWAASPYYVYGILLLYFVVNNSI